MVDITAAVITTVVVVTIPAVVDSTQAVEAIIQVEEVITLVADTNFNIESCEVGVLQGTPIFYK